MAKYVVEHNYVQVVGVTWEGCTSAYEYTLHPYDIDCIEMQADIRFFELSQGSYNQDEITRADVCEWLKTHSGDFERIIDFCASIRDTDIEWDDVENATLYNESMSE